jgi:uncharacterized protein DUF3800
MPRNPWIPKEHEAQLFYEVYMDETSQNGRHRFFVLGGVMFPMIYSDMFEAAMIDARPERLKRLRSNGQLPEIAWKYVSNGDYEDYKLIVDAYFGFKTQLNATALDDFRFHCVVLDTTIEGRRYARGLEGEDNFNREIYFLGERIARTYVKALFHVYPAKRSTIRPRSHLPELGLMINRKIAQRHDERDFPVRRLDFRENKHSQALQISDLLIGALAYRINRHYDQRDANKDKKLLADYILQRGRYLVQINKGRLKSKNWGDFQIYIRRHKDWGPTTLDRYFGHGPESGLT